jgi:hypothetical protein
MNDTIRKTVENLDMLRNTRIEEVNIQLKDLLDAYRERLDEQSAQLSSAAPNAEKYGTLLDEVASTVDLIRVLVKASDDMDKLQASAIRVMDRVYKKLLTLGEPTT